MERYFTEIEAKRVFDYNSAYISKIENYFNSASFYQNDIAKKSSDIFYNGIFEKFCEDEIMYGKSLLNTNSDLLELIKLIYRFRTASYYINQCNQFFNTRKDVIRDYLHSLSASTEKMKWFFASSTTKDLAVDAYNYFNSKEHFDFMENINQQIEFIDGLNNPDIESALSDYYKNSQVYGRIVCNCNKDIYYSPRDINVLKSVFYVHEQIYSDTNRIISSQKWLVDDVITNTSAYIADKTMEELSNTPIEAIKRSGDGLKIKPLIDNGINNVADLYNNCYLIEAFQGIGELTAPKYQATAINYYNDARKNIRVRLNADNRDETSNRLLKSLFFYIHKTDIAQKLYDSWIQNEEKIRNSILVLEQITNGIQWLFYTPEQKLNVNKAYECLKGLIESEYYINSKRLIDEADRLDYLPEDMIWNDYIDNTIIYINTLEQLCDEIFNTRNSQAGDASTSHFDSGLIIEDSYGLNPQLASEINEENYSLDGLNCVLRRYQIWGLKYILHQKRVLLGDEMGLGKTVQAIASIIALRNAGAVRFVVVCPASVLQNWCAEFKDKSDITPLMMYGNIKEKVLNYWLHEGGVIVTTYETIKSINIPEILIDMLVVDEAHYVKNPQAQRTQSIKRLLEKSSHILFMTGTALENNVDEMINLIDMINGDISEELRLTMHSPFSFKNIIMPVYYRRRRDDVLKELPDLIESNEWCQMTYDDILSYNQCVLDKNFMQARRVSWNVNDLNNSSKARRVIEIIREVEEDGRKIIVFSYFLETIQKIKEYLGDRCLQPIDGSVSPIRRQEIVQEFSNAPAGSVLLAQIQTGGTGLNIQTASVVIICEPQFKPSVENQAISRAYRMGQNRNVFVYRMLCMGSIDERMIEILGRKQDLFNDYADESYAAEEDNYAMQNEPEIKESKFNELMQEEYNRIYNSSINPIVEGEAYEQGTYYDGQRT